jgi:hypothetical protein
VRYPCPPASPISAQRRSLPGGPRWQTASGLPPAFNETARPTRYARTGSAFPFKRSLHLLKMEDVACVCCRSRRAMASPGRAAPIRRAATFIVSPITVYSACG